MRLFLNIYSLRVEFICWISTVVLQFIDLTSIHWGLAGIYAPLNWCNLVDLGNNACSTDRIHRNKLLFSTRLFPQHFVLSNYRHLDCFRSISFSQITATSIVSAASRSLKLSPPRLFLQHLVLSNYRHFDCFNSISFSQIATTSIVSTASRSLKLPPLRSLPHHLVLSNYHHRDCFISFSQITATSIVSLAARSL